MQYISTLGEISAKKKNQDEVTPMDDDRDEESDEALYSSFLHL